MSGSLELIKAVLSSPDKIAKSFAAENVKLYYKYQKYGSTYLLVVVKYLNHHAFVITAFYTKKLSR